MNKIGYIISVEDYMAHFIKTKESYQRLALDIKHPSPQKNKFKYSPYR